MLLRQAGLLEQAAVIIVRHETNLHTFFLVRRLEVAMPCHCPRIALGLFAQREDRASELVLSQGKQKVTLVLARVASALEQMAHARVCAVRPFLNARKMAGGDELRAELVRAVDQPAEL